MFERKKSAGKIYFLPIDQIHPSPFQARRTFEEQELAGLAQSIRENGLLQPISVRKAAEGYELVAGERRLRACQLAKMTTIPAILCNYGDEQTAALGLLEEAEAGRQMEEIRRRAAQLRTGPHGEARGAAKAELERRYVQWQNS